MWIRSQDKLCLTKNDAMVIVDNHKNNKKVWSLINVGGFQYNLGTYNSKERALEVLDEIQAYLENNYVAINDMPQHNNNPWIDYYPRYITRTTKTVYQMPKERLNEKDKM